MSALHLFEGHGIEIERMIVHGDDLSVAPVSDRLLRAAGDRGDGDVLRGETAWSNELVLHVVEQKCSAPRPSLDGLSRAFARDVTDMEGLLAPLGCRLLPTGMHPLMNPLRETRIWPHGTREVYALYDRVFGCSGHGFANLQSVHVNLPFAGDDEFGRLHAAIRLALPLLPALAASSPFVEGRATGVLDNRLVAYRRNQRLIPSITGQVVPERAFTRAEYEDRVIRPIARDVARSDPEGILDPEWVNSRGAIARFGRGSIEIRVIDAQECARADVEVAAAAVAVVRALVEERFTSHESQRVVHECRLEPIYARAVNEGPAAVVDDEEILRAFGATAAKATLGELWAHLVRTLDVRVDGRRRALDVILRQGCLSERILRATGPDPSAARVRAVYGALADCLRGDECFEP
jgi:gamma-glutamyl:cysteine ligase YbdK (ATP-grasp superfamily)